MIGLDFDAIGRLFLHSGEFVLSIDRLAPHERSKKIWSSILAQPLPYVFLIVDVHLAPNCPFVFLMQLIRPPGRLLLPLRRPYHPSLPLTDAHLG